MHTADTVRHEGRAPAEGPVCPRCPLAGPCSCGNEAGGVGDRRALFRAWRPLLWFASAVLILLIVGALVLVPAYMDPNSRTYSSALGFAAVRRKLGIPFPVVVAKVESRVFSTPMHGEGSMQCDFLFVPVVPMAKVLRVNVKDGDTVYAGQELAVMDDEAARIQIESARVAVSTAEAEERRVKIGSAYVLAQERPEKDRILLEEAEKLMDSMRAKTEVYRKLADEGALSGMELAKAEAELVEAKARLEQARFNIRMSTEGVEESRRIAANAVADARNLLADRERKLRDYKVACPVEGVVERVLIREGEYNQDSGKPGFVIASGRWFEGNFDQRALTRMQPGSPAVVFLEAYPGKPFKAKVERIIPVVTFNQGGPESTRPVRPRGTGSPEWPATFKARLVLDRDEAPPAVGMTGFARVTQEDESPAVPRAALLSLGAGRATVRVLTAAGGHRLAVVRVGDYDGTHARILEGLLPDDHVIVAGHRDLRDGDKIAVVRSGGGGP